MKRERTVYWFVWVHITKNYSLDGFNNRNVFSDSSEDPKSKIKLPSGLVSDDSPLLEFADSCHLAMCSHNQSTEEVGANQLSDISSHRDTNPTGSGPHPYDLNLNYFLTPHRATLGDGVSTYAFGGT